MESNPTATPSQPSPAPEGEVDLSRAAVGWTIALVVGIAIATFSAASDRAQLSTLERAAENTAVGDIRYYAPGAKDASKLVFAGSPLVPAEKTSESLPEARMRLAGYTDDASFRLYVPQERENSNDATGGPSWYLKTGPGLFLRMGR